MRRPIPVAAGVFAMVASVGSCGSDSSTSPSSSSSSSLPQSGRCIIRLHGKGGAGGPDEGMDGAIVRSPDGNEPAGDGREWLYFPEDRYTQAVDVVDQAATGCDEVVIDGFSNGGAFAAKLYCRGETLDGRLRGVVVDDPVVDHGTEGCAPDPMVNVALYWTGALEPPAVPGWECSEGGWTCEGGTTVGIDAYATALGTGILSSPFEDHQWYLDAPQLAQW